MPQPPKLKARSRYSIGEWYGVGFETMSSAERFRRAKVEMETPGLTGTKCPFQHNATCNKKGGVCSLRAYQQISDGPVAGMGPLITTCPNRFLESDTIFQWVGKTILNTESPIVLGEIGFLD